MSHPCRRIKLIWSRQPLGFLLEPCDLDVSEVIAVHPQGDVGVDDIEVTAYGPGDGSGMYASGRRDVTRNVKPDVLRKLEVLDNLSPRRLSSQLFDTRQFHFQQMVE